MVKFKIIKYKHYLKAIEMTKRVDAGEATADEGVQYIAGMVKEWDFLDVETEEPLVVSLESLGELSIEQMNEMVMLFNQIMSSRDTVPKASAERLPSSLIESSQEPKTLENALIGFPPSS